MTCKEHNKDDCFPCKNQARLAREEYEELAALAGEYLVEQPPVAQPHYDKKHPAGNRPKVFDNNGNNSKENTLSLVPDEPDVAQLHAVPKECSELNSKGDPCQAPPIHGTDKCISHSDKKLKEELSFSGKQPGAGRPKRPREIELVENVAKRKEKELENVLTEGLTANKPTVVGNGPGAEVIFSPDHTHRLKTFQEILNRLHGTPRQTVTSNITSHNLDIVLDASDPDTRDTINSLLRANPVTSNV